MTVAAGLLYRIMKNFISALMMMSMSAVAFGADSDGAWEKLGTGVYNDFVISSIYNKTSTALSVEYERNTTDPNMYRIQKPYANWSDYRVEGLVYDPTKATPMVIHVVDDKYAWIESFNTGLIIDTADDYGPIVGEITVVPQMEEMIKNNGFEAVLKDSPTALCAYNQGTMTLGEDYILDGRSYPNIRIDVAGEPIWKGNKRGVFRLQLPFAPDLEPTMKWNTLDGYAIFTDGLTSLFAFQDEPVYPELKVKIQQNEVNPNIYRLVNPYAEWNVNYSAYDFQYDNSDNYYITIYTFPEYNVACTNTFYTGLNVRIKGEKDFEMFGVQNQAFYFYESYAKKFGWYIEEVADEFGYMFGTFEDGVITYPGYYEDEYSGQIMEFPMFTGWTGSYVEAEKNDYIYAVNKAGKFKIVFPGQEDPEEGGDNSVIESVVDDDCPAEYYNLQGQKIKNPSPGAVVIERRGDRSTKKIM